MAATVSAGSMMMLFGGAGAGLTGYRMIRRTRGVQEFEFEQYDQKVLLAALHQRLLFRCQRKLICSCNNTEEQNFLRGSD